MKDKRVVMILAMALAMAIVLGACGGGKKSAEPTQASKTAVPTKSAQVQPTKVKPTNTIAPTATKAPTPTAKPLPTNTAEPTAVATEEIGAEIEKITAKQKQLTKELSVLDSYKMKWNIAFTVVLKDGTEKKMPMETEMQVINKPSMKSKLVIKQGGENAMTISVIRIGDDAWIDAGGGTWMHMPAQQVEGMVGSMLMDTNDVAYIGKELRKGTKKIGPLQCTVYKFDKKNIIHVAEKHPEAIPGADLKMIKGLDTWSGEACVTKNDLLLEYHMKIVSSDPTNVFGMDFAEMEGVQPENVKKAVFSIDEEVFDINAKFDITPPSGG